MRRSYRSLIKHWGNASPTIKQNTAIKVIVGAIVYAAIIAIVHHITDMGLVDNMIRNITRNIENIAEDYDMLIVGNTIKEETIEDEKSSYYKARIP